LFLLKKIVAPFFFPVPLCLGILLLGLFFLWFTSRQKNGKIVVSVGVLLLTVFSYGTISNTLLRPLEYKYAPLLSLEDMHHVKWVVVLGGGHTSDPQIPITSQLSNASTARLIEGIRLYNMLPESKIILSGGGYFDPVPNAKIMADVALSIGINKEDLVLESVSKDTKDEAILIQKIVGKDRFVLVTSASHMPRSMALFKKCGMHPIPAPTDYFVKKRQRVSPGIFFPSANNLCKAERAFHEYLGIAWAKLRGQI
jgi:uncharacterized SAM-binding protein YcdF (DUF218 family)